MNQIQHSSDEFRNWIDGMLLINDTGEGIGADYMFAQHSGYGRQINATSYGNEMYKSVLSYIEATNGTVYGVTHLANLAKRHFKCLPMDIVQKSLRPECFGQETELIQLQWQNWFLFQIECWP